MKKGYEAPKAERMEFNYLEAVVASNGCGGAYQLYTDKYEGCNITPTGKWVQPFSDYAAPITRNASGTGE